MVDRGWLIVDRRSPRKRLSTIICQPSNKKGVVMTTRTLAQVETATNEKVGIFKIKNVLPTRNLKQLDPFLLIHHMQPYHLKPTDDVRIPPHPHAGFEVKTYLLD